jgi:hypothetical protein
VGSEPGRWSFKKVGRQSHPYGHAIFGHSALSRLREIVSLRSLGKISVTRRRGQGDDRSRSGPEGKMRVRAAAWEDARVIL